MSDAVDVPSLNSLLTTLRAHKVSEYRSDQFGLHIKLESKESALEWQGKPERTTPETGAVDAQRLNLDDVLYGAK